MKFAFFEVKKRKEIKKQLILLHCIIIYTVYIYLYISIPICEDIFGYCNKKGNVWVGGLIATMLKYLLVGHRIAKKKEQIYTTAT